MRTLALMSTIHALRRILATCRTIAVVGLSPQWHRPSFFAAKYMQEHGFRIVPINPAAPEILGQRSYPSVTAAVEAGEKIDMVDCFRKSSDIPPLADEAIAIGAKCLWMQIGVVDEASAAKARAAGLDVVMDRCVKIEHARLFGGLNWAGVDTKVISARRPQQLFY
ncbi:MAG: CoA-binding protein [Ramlibacter sp.]|nr:CoA-binding protein [Ramlibacter sp.]MCE3270577.1 CoA-binding protein [Ramlibacter sp.]